jgi:hypothetical protein
VDQNLLLEVERKLPSMPIAVQQKVGQLIAEARKSITYTQARSDFMAYVKYKFFSHSR